MGRCILFQAKNRGWFPHWTRSSNSSTSEWRLYMLSELLGSGVISCNTSRAVRRWRQDARCVCSLWEILIDQALVRCSCHFSCKPTAGTSISGPLPKLNILHQTLPSGGAGYETRTSYIQKSHPQCLQFHCCVHSCMLIQCHGAPNLEMKYISL
jgi:hypothetical protein